MFFNVGAFDIAVHIVQPLPAQQGKKQAEYVFYCLYPEQLLNGFFRAVR